MYKYKYEKYKTKVDNLYKNMGLMGGAITRNDALKKILSIQVYLKLLLKDHQKNALYQFTLLDLVL